MLEKYKLKIKYPIETEHDFKNAVIIDNYDLNNDICLEVKPHEYKFEFYQRPFHLDHINKSWLTVIL